jgi:hypothetical protein
VADGILETVARRAAEEVLAKAFDELERRIERAIARALEQRDDDSLRPLHKILGGTADAARMRLLRDPELAKLGIVTGAYVFASGKLKGTRAERLKFRPSEVHALVQSRKRGGGTASAVDVGQHGRR